METGRTTPTRGFECLLNLVDKYRPRYLIHGHVHVNYGFQIPRVLQRGETTIINAYELYVLDLENPPKAESP